MGREGTCTTALAATCPLLAVLALAAPAVASIPAPAENFLGMGATQGSCVFPPPPGGEPSSCVTTGDPPDVAGAVGPNDYVQLDNGGIAVYDKSGNLRGTPEFLNKIWNGYATTDGNNCAAKNWGDPIVRYDQLADRWLISQFDITNYVNGSNTGPSYECVAVSKTGDPTGGWWLYDFEYSVGINDYPKFGIWPDAYYVSYNEFDPSFVDSKVCALDRTSMLAGQAARAQQCFTESNFSLLPANVDGSLPPPTGSPEYVAGLATNAIDLFKFHVDWTDPTNSSLTGPTALPVSSFTEACTNGGNCIPQESPGNQLASLGDRMMDRAVYRNFGDHKSLLLNHSVTSGGVAGIRWYEVRDPGGTPSLYQQGTYQPDPSYRWMGSIAQDQAGDIAIGYSKSSSTTTPSIAYTGRLASDPLGTTPQGEGTIATGVGVETGNFNGDPNQPAQRWGDYTTMNIDPSDDCTFWYVNELYPSNGIFNWDTRIASFKFPNCAQNDFSIAANPPAIAVSPGAINQTTLSTTPTKGVAEAVSLSRWDLPSGVTASFSPTSVLAGNSSTLTFTVPQGTPLGTYTIQVAGTAPSALHGTTVTLNVTPTQTLTVSKSAAGSGRVTSMPAGIDCGSVCNQTFAQGSSVTLNAAPDPGSVFLGWSGAGCSSSCMLTMDADKAVTANFDTLPACTALAGLKAQHNTPLQVALSCSDPDPGDTLTYAIVSGPSHGTLGTPDSAGNVTYTPNSGYAGADSFTYGATDSHGQDSGTATVNLTVAQVAPPTCANKLLSVKHNTSGSLALSCSHPETSTSLKYSIVSPPRHGTLGAVSPTGTVTYKPRFGYGGPDAFTYRATDVHGQASNPATVSITVGANHPPVCHSQIVNVAHAKAKQIALGCSDTDPGDTLHWAILTKPRHGQLGTINRTGRLTYTPKSSFGGTDSFTFQAIDNEGGRSRPTAVVLHVAGPCAGIKDPRKLRACTRAHKAPDRAAARPRSAAALSPSIGRPLPHLPMPLLPAWIVQRRAF